MKYFFLLFFILNSVNGIAQSGIQKLVDSLAAGYLQDKPGAVIIGINTNGKTKYFSYGETEKGNHQLPDSNSIFELGSLTETFTSILFADMTINGFIKMDDQLQKYLPVHVVSPMYQQMVCKLSEAKKEPVPATNKEDAYMKLGFSTYICLPDPSAKPQPILLWYLSVHTSGFPEYPDNLNSKKQNPFSDYTEEQLYSFLNDYSLEKPIGFDYKHSDAGIALLGHTLSLRMKMSYDSLLTSRILVPLNMQDTRINLSDKQMKHYLTGYNEKGKVMPHYTYKVLAPAGGLNTSMKDMMRFLSQNISIEKNSMTDMLDFTHNPRIKLDESSSKDSEIALGWKVNPMDVESKKIVWQDSKRGGFAAYIGFCETSHTGVVILSSVSKEVSELGKRILQQLESEKL